MNLPFDAPPAMELETLHGRKVWKSPIPLHHDGVFDCLRTSRPRWRVIASVLPSELDAAIDSAMYLAAIEEGVLSPVNSRKSLGAWSTCACKLPARIKPKVNFAHGHDAGLGHVCNERQCAASAEGVRELVGVLRRSSLFSPFHLFTYNDDVMRLALSWLVWEAWDRLFTVADDTSVFWAQSLPCVLAELRVIAMRAAIDAAPLSEIPVASSNLRTSRAAL